MGVENSNFKTLRGKGIYKCLKLPIWIQTNLRQFATLNNTGFAAKELTEADRTMSHKYWDVLRLDCAAKRDFNMLAKSADNDHNLVCRHWCGATYLLHLFLKELIACSNVSKRGLETNFLMNKNVLSH